MNLDPKVVNMIPPLLDLLGIFPSYQVESFDTVYGKADRKPRYLT